MLTIFAKWVLNTPVLRLMQLKISQGKRIQEQTYKNSHIEKRAWVYNIVIFTVLEKLRSFWNDSFSAFVGKMKNYCRGFFIYNDTNLVNPLLGFCPWRPRLILSLKSWAVRDFRCVVNHSHESLSLCISTQTGSKSSNGLSHP